MSQQLVYVLFMTTYRYVGDDENGRADFSSTKHFVKVFGNKESAVDYARKQVISHGAVPRVLVSDDDASVYVFPRCTPNCEPDTEYAIRATIVEG